MRWSTFILIWVIGFLTAARLIVLHHNIHSQPHLPQAQIQYWEDIVRQHPHYADGWEKLHDLWQAVDPSLAEYCHQQAVANAPWRFAN